MVAGLSDREITADIIESCRKGDREAFHALFLAYKDKVYSIALYFFHGDEAAAGDITQQVFLKLLLGIGQFRNEADFSTWLYRLVVNACMDGARRAKPQNWYLERSISILCLEPNPWSAILRVRKPRGPCERH